jgi:hypothetical protein
MGNTVLLFACGSYRKDMSDVTLALLATGHKLEFGRKMLMI